MSNDFVMQDNKINELIKNKTVLTLEQKYCNAFNDYVSQHYSWFPTRINWEASGKNFTKFEWLYKDKNKIRAYFENSILGKMEKICIIYSANQKGLIVDIETLINNLSIFSYDYGFKYGVHFFVGAHDNKSDNIELENEIFFEVDYKYMISPSSH